MTSNDPHKTPPARSAENVPAKAKAVPAQKPLDAQEVLRRIEDHSGLLALANQGLDARENRTIKNRIIAGLFGLLTVSMAGNVGQYLHQPETKLLGETPDGRIRTLPLLNDPIYSHADILAWSQKCVETAYRLSYVDWETSINNNSFCFSDGTRKAFKASIEKVGLLKYLTPELQGILYARSGIPEMKNYQLNARGYYEWIVDVPYTVTIDGRERGSMDVVMTMKIRRTSLVLRSDGLWVESFRITPRTNQGR